jgi:hypothetical protein
VGGELVPIEFERSFSNQIQQLARKNNITPFAFLLAAYHILLYRYTGQEEVVVGTPSYGRHDPSWANIFGCFVNVLPLRLNISGNPTFPEYLIRVRDAVFGAMEHQAFPFPLTVERLRLRRDLVRKPVFQAFFNLASGGGGELGPFFAGAEDFKTDFGAWAHDSATGRAVRDRRDAHRGQWAIYRQSELQ